MELFIRLRSNPRYAMSKSGLLKDMGGVVSLPGSRKVLKRRPKDGFHQMEVNGKPEKVSFESLLAEITEISQTDGISLTHG